MTSRCAVCGMRCAGRYCEGHDDLPWLDQAETFRVWNFARAAHHEFSNLVTLTEARAKARFDELYDLERELGPLATPDVGHGSARSGVASGTGAMVSRSREATPSDPDGAAR